MAKLGHSRFSSRGDLAGERLIEAMFAPERYPEGATFIGAGEDHFPVVLAEAVAERRSIVIVYSDGRELVGEPRDGTLAFRERMRPTAISEEESR
jgi:uncharacterized protein with von Willebrand factor type A (vWA) domain